MTPQNFWRFGEDCTSLLTLKCHIVLDCYELMPSLYFFIFELCPVFSVSVEDCKFMDSKTRPLFLVFKNGDDLGDLVRIIFKNGDGECGISFDRLIVTLLKRFTCSLV